MAVGFKYEELKWQWKHQLHPATRAILEEADRYLTSRGLPGILITRIADSQAGVDAKYKKKGRFSWHLPDQLTGKVRAADFRNTDPKTGEPLWDELEANLFEHWLNTNWPGAEILFHDIGKGNHGHIAVPRIWSVIKRLRRVAARRSEA